MGEVLQSILSVVGLVCLWIGVFFCALAVVGMYRFPDVYSRLHASGKVTTLGLAGLMLGAALLMPATALKAIALGVFIVITSPVATHAIAMAAYRSGVPLRGKDGQPLEQPPLAGLPRNEEQAGQ